MERNQQADTSEEHDPGRPWKIALALVGASAMPALISATFVCIALVYGTRISGNLDSWDHLLSRILFASAFTFYVVFVVAAAHVLVLGLPMCWLAARIKLIRWWSCLIISFLIGMLPLLVFDRTPSPSEAPYLARSTFAQYLAMAGPTLAIFGALGMSGGFTFWLLWRFWVHHPHRAT